MATSSRPCSLWLDAVLAVARLLREAEARVLVECSPRAAELLALRAEVFRLRAECELLRARILRMEPTSRPRYARWERLRILWHRARHGLSTRETARLFVVRVSTLQAWLRSLPSVPPSGATPAKGPRGLAAVVGHLARLLRWDNPAWGTRRIAQVLARLGIKVSRSSVQRQVRTKPQPPTPTVPRRKSGKAVPRKKARAVRAKRPHHVWLIDITVVKFLFGMVQLRVAAVLDAFTRSIVVLDVCRTEPSADWICRLFARGVRAASRAPKHLVTDRGVQFTSRQFKAAVKHRGVRQRFGAIGSHGGIALIERCWGSLKREALPLWCCFLNQDALRVRLQRWARWQNVERPHQGIDGLTPREKLRRPRASRPRRMLDFTACSNWELDRLAFEGDTALPVYRLRKVG
ncbi:MAG: DDE-type integrase/transposase/recombinase [Planctomycetes bacterium]|nr:DDE-type integrase/transposase/recombinase [Planctomycetota bacterium]